MSAFPSVFNYSKYQSNTDVSLSNGSIASSLKSNPVQFVNFTAKQYNIYDVNTQAGSISVQLPEGASDGCVLFFTNNANSFATHNLIILNGSYNINGSASSFNCDQSRGVYECIYSNQLNNWNIVVINGTGGGGIMTPLPPNYIYVGNNSNVATPVSVTGDIQLSQAGLTTVVNNSINNSKLSQATAYTWKGNNSNATTNITDNSISSLIETGSNVLTITGINNILNPTTIQVRQANGIQGGYLSSTDWNTFNSKASNSLTNNQIFVGNASNVATSVPMSGDVAITNTGATTIQNNVVSNSKLSTMALKTIKGNNTASTANPLDLSIVDVNNMISNNNSIIYVSKNGVDTNNGQSENSAVLTIAQALILANSNDVIFLMPGSYTETLTIAKDLWIVSNSSASITSITVSSVNTLKLYNITIGTATFSSGAAATFNSCSISSLNWQSNSYYFFTSGALSTLNHTGAASATILNTSINTGVTINNASALLIIQNSPYCASITVTAGVCYVLQSNLYGASNVITTASGSYLYVKNSSIMTNQTSLGVPATINIVPNSFYSLQDVSFDSYNSTLSGTLINATDFIQKISLISLNYKVNYITTGGGTTTLINTSNFMNILTGSSAHTVVLPDATTMFNGDVFYFINNSSLSVTIQNSATTVLATLLPSSDAFVILQSNATAAGVWYFSYSIIANNMTSTVSNGTTLTLTSGSAPIQQITGSSTQLIILPVATSLPSNHIFKIINNSTGLVTIQKSDASALTTVATLSQVDVISPLNTVTPGNWIVFSPSSFQITPVQPTFVSTANTLGSSNQTGCVFDGTNFVSVISAGSSGIAISTDGISWTFTNSVMPSGQNWISIAYGGGVYVAVASAATNVAAWATNPRSWTSSTLPSAITWGRVAYIPGVFVATSSNPTTAAAASIDYGKTWAAVTFPSSANWGQCLAAGIVVSTDTPYLVAIAYNSTANAYSTNGTTWTSGSALAATGLWMKLIYGGGFWVAVSQTGQIVYTSNPTTAWSTASISPASTLTTIGYGNGIYIVLGTTSTGYYSKNLTTWTAFTLSVSPASQFTDLIYGYGLFTAISSSSSSSFYGYFTDAPVVPTKSKNNQLITANDVYNAVSFLPNNAIPPSISSIVPVARKFIQYDNSLMYGINNNFYNVTSTAVANATTTLTKSSSKYQIFTGNNPAQFQNLSLPVATTLPVGVEYQVYNRSLSTLVVLNPDLSTLIQLQSGCHLNLLLTGNTTSNGTWQIEIVNNNQSYSSITAIGSTTTLTAASPSTINLTGTSAQTIVLPVVSTLYLGLQYTIINSTSNLVTVQSSGLNTIDVVSANSMTMFTVVAITGTTASSWLSSGSLAIKRNLQFNYLSVPAAATVTLTPTSNQYQSITGSTDTVISLPIALYIGIGTSFYFFNQMTANSVTVNTFGGTNVTFVPPLCMGIVTLATQPNNDGTWNVSLINNSIPNDVYVSGTTTQNISSGTETVLSTCFNSVLRDPLSQFTLASGVFTAKYAGLYLVTANISFGVNATGSRYLRVRLNGATNRYLVYQSVCSGTNPDILTGSAQIRLVAGDTITIGAFQSSGITLSAIASTSNGYGFILIEKISD
jgi:hypothetical protein